MWCWAYRPETKGAGYALNRLNFITSLKEGEVEDAKSRAAENEKTKWFRPSDVVIGTDGAIYVADWYDSMVGGHRMTDTTGNGRIYRIAPKGKKLTSPKINLKNTKGQIAALLNPAVNVRNAGFVLLAAKGDKVVKDVKKILAISNPYHRARATWLLANMGPKGVAEVENHAERQRSKFTDDGFPGFAPGKTRYFALCPAIKQRPFGRVRREVAVALRDMPLEKIQNIAVDLASQYDGQDRYYLEALGLALTG